MQIAQIDTCYEPEHELHVRVREKSGSHYESSSFREGRPDRGYQATHSPVTSPDDRHQTINPRSLL